MKAWCFLACGSLCLIGSLALPGFAAQEGRGKQLPPDPKAVVDMVARIKKGVDGGMALHLVLTPIGNVSTVVPALVKLLDDPKMDRLGVVTALFNLGGDSALVVPALVKVLQKEQNPSVRQFAVKALSRHGRRAVPVLLDVLTSARDNDMGKNLGVRSAALWAMSVLWVHDPSSQRKALVAALAPLMKHKDADVRRAVIECVGHTQGADPRTMRVLPHPGLTWLLAALKDDDARLRELAVTALGDARAGPDEDRMVPPLLELALKDPNAKGRWSAIHVLAGMGDRGIKPLLAARWGDKQIAIGAALLNALATKAPRSSAALPFLLNNLGDHRAAQALAAMNFGDAARDAIPALTGLLKDGNELQRHWAFEALFAVGGGGPTVVANYLRDRDSQTRAAVLVKLKNRGFRSTEAVPVLIVCLKDKSAPVRMLAAEVLGAMGPDARGALAALDLALDDRDPMVRASVQAAVKRIRQ